jgi:hypothetical protein
VRRRSYRYIFTVVVISFASCAGLRALEPRTTAWDAPPEASIIRAKLVEGANSILGKWELVVRGRKFDWDCTGVVRAIYWYAGIDLARDFAAFPGNGVARLFGSLERAGLLYDTRRPIAGDIVFWDDTYDANGDGRWNDPLTHVGMVMKTDQDGIISYVHQNVRRGIVVESMSLSEPSTYQKNVLGRMILINSPMRMAEQGVPHPDKWLAGQLYRSFGKGYLF